MRCLPDSKCCWPRCNEEYVAKYCGKPVCNVHERLITDQNLDKANSARAKIGVKKLELWKGESPFVPYTTIAKAPEALPASVTDKPKGRRRGTTSDFTSFEERLAAGSFDEGD